MPPRLRLRPGHIRPSTNRTSPVCWQCRHASLATATTPAAPVEQMIQAATPIARHSLNQPPSHKPPEFRKSQLHRQYQSLIRSSPLMLIFQHNNLKSTEWTGIRRELAAALRVVDAELEKSGSGEEMGDYAKLQVIQTGIFASALKVVEFWNPDFQSNSSSNSVADPHSATSTESMATSPVLNDAMLTHGLSREAWKATKRNAHLKHGLEPLLSGPLAILSLPAVSPQHLKVVLSILSPSPEFPAPKRKARPSYHEPAVQSGLQKLMLLGARVEGQTFDTDGARWVGSIGGGLDGLRGQLVAMLQGVGAGITNTLESASRSLYVTVEGRRGMLEEEEKVNA